ncbi:hypothetical protein [Massilia endophytica]|uniref:hypothetical protein n=1 Tax=Massilia endophytica TaxID=2899220 RepID=UPI001E3D2E07|nr:hypothetical protein [Massilia endophytica]UGQ47417.1 hypothetical protein LSQ66_02740 [Massilia endophytica]
MLRRFLPLLIALSLLMSQLVTLSHGYTHWTPAKPAAVTAQPSASAGLGDPVLSDALCQLCLVAGQLASAIHGSTQHVRAIDGPALHTGIELLQHLDRVTTVVFRSRAPPAL